MKLKPDEQWKNEEQLEMFHDRRDSLAFWGVVLLITIGIVTVAAYIW